MTKVPDVHFYFLGWGELQAQLETAVQEAGISDVVTIRYEARPLQFLNQSSIFVSLQAVENYPSQSLIEAMACGNAIVATDVGETWRLVDESNGLRVSPSAEAIAAAIIDLLQNPDLFRLGSASRQRILQDYTPERFFNYITGVYRAAASVPYGSYREGIRFKR
jgi:glycosyltransferase involved in cell wall biosynthesis